MRYVAATANDPPAKRATAATREVAVCWLLDAFMCERERLGDMPTIVVLQEAPKPAARVLSEHGYQVVSEGEFHTGIRPAGQWIRDATVVSHVSDWGLPCAFANSVTGARVTVYNVHLLSRYRAQDVAIEHRAASLRQYVWQQRGSGASGSEVVAGDFNLPPTDRVLLVPMHDGLGANRCSHWIGRNRRGGRLRERGFLNASWSLLGRTQYPLASYYYKNEIDGPWYQYDQVLLSPDLLLGNLRADAELIDKIGGISLVTAGRYREPNKNVGSDHLPVHVRIRAAGAVP